MSLPSTQYARSVEFAQRVMGFRSLTTSCPAVGGGAKIDLPSCMPIHSVTTRSFRPKGPRRMHHHFMVEVALIDDAGRATVLAMV